ncbi:hypothetical protein CXR25_13905 [Brevibacterium aurantiacum]|uniref:hypothetical protein n=1 Tax=Brevibacterium aurantiacum TaxID=273384 RepID=UPI000F6489BB|nr:hypothetical protein [Brevibacterium aurantiacum]AZL13790.1 hypothetical protein CXR25_13905 [Brevibacterium aurantiacum]
MTILKEAGTLTKKEGGRFKIQIVTPGVGSSGTYPQATIEAAGRDKVFGQGLHMYLDHATEAQDWAKPEGSLRDLVGVLDEDAHWDEASGGLVAEARIYSHWRPILEEMKDDIGVSIRASGEVREDAGQRIITKLVEARSVDFVTKAGRGGKVMEVLESARLREGINDETRDLLSKAVRAAHPESWSWVRDHDGSTVWFDAETDTGDNTYEQAYTQNGITITLDGEPTEVVPTTVYVPKANPDPTGKETQESNQKEAATMATIQIEEADHTALVTKAGRVEQLESDLAEAQKKLEAAEAEKAKEARRAEVAGVVEEAFENTDAGLIKDIIIDRLAETDATGDDLIKEARTFAEDFKTKTAGTGQVRGLGESRPANTTEAEPTPRTAEDIVNVLEGA